MTRFLYRSDNFRLLRLKSEKYTKSGLTYTSNSGVKQNYSYQYDLSGNIINISDTTTNCGYGTTPDALSRNFIYDALYRLLSATGRETAATGTTPWDDLYRPENESLARGYRQLYDYDKLGNIQSLQHIATSGNFTRSFDYGSFTKNALQKITISSNVYHFAYDVNGNMLSEGDTARHLEYDCADRLRCFYVQPPAAEPSKYTHYLYDGAGNRVKKITRKQSGKYTATTYIDGAFEYTKESTGFDGIPNLKIGTWKIGSYSSGGEQNILHLMGGATRRIGASLGDSTPTIKYNLSDHLGSSSVQLDASGTTVSLEEYYPFGETSFGSYAKKRYRFCGKEKDEESGLYYFGARYYSAWTCRFISIDPMARKYPMKTPYHYCSNNPINKTDPTGMEDGNPKAPSNAGKGGGQPPKASDGTGTTDGVGKDVIHGVETWIDKKTGEIKVRVHKRYSRQVDDAAISVEAKKAIKEHWANIQQKQAEEKAAQEAEAARIQKEAEDKIAAEEAQKKTAQEAEQKPVGQQKSNTGKSNSSGEANSNKNSGSSGGNNGQPPPENKTTQDEEGNKITNMDIAGGLQKATHDAILTEQYRVKKQLTEALRKSTLKNKISNQLANLMLELKKISTALKKVDITGKIMDITNILVEGVSSVIEPIVENVEKFVNKTIETGLEIWIGAMLKFDLLTMAAVNFITNLDIFKTAIKWLANLILPFFQYLVLVLLGDFKNTLIKILIFNKYFRTLGNIKLT